MPNQRMFPIEERLSRVEAQAIVGADQAAGLLSLIRFVESDLRACADLIVQRSGKCESSEPIRASSNEKRIR